MSRGPADPDATCMSGRPLPCPSKGAPVDPHGTSASLSAGVRAEPSATDPVGKQIGKRHEATQGLGIRSGVPWPIARCCRLTLRSAPDASQCMLLVGTVLLSRAAWRARLRGGARFQT